MSWKETFIAVTVSVCFLVPLSVILHGCVFTLLWEWLIVPSFGVTKLTLPQAIFAFFIVRVFFERSVNTDEANSLSDFTMLAYKHTVKSVIHCVLTLIVGLVIKSVVM